MKKFAAIDLGSNAVRLAIAEMTPANELQVLRKYRIPLRLGVEAFNERHRFSDSTIAHAVEIFQQLRMVMDEEKISHYRAYATAAFRESSNAAYFAESIEQKSGLKLEGISGDVEAALILSAVKKKLKLKDSVDYLLFDLGGGSLELSMIEHGLITGSKSFELGTLRYLELSHQGNDAREKYISLIKAQIEKFIDDDLRDSPRLHLIGTGGNFRRVLKIKRKIKGDAEKFVRLSDLGQMQRELEKVKFLDRIEKFELRADRADVIIPAIKIIREVIGTLPVKKIFCPNVGLIHGILYSMHDNKKISGHELVR
jgi:exopolyphosphatase / guanosine-5'-triphosphate,3'-diphosphate pyrophosphatase